MAEIMLKSLSLIALLISGCSTQEFGHTRLRDFIMRSNYTNLNHGSYGAVPKVVLAAQSALRERVEACPDQWSDRAFDAAGSHCSPLAGTDGICMKCWTASVLRCAAGQSGWFTITFRLLTTSVLMHLMLSSWTMPLMVGRPC